MIRVYLERPKRKPKGGKATRGPWRLRWLDYNGREHRERARLPSGLAVRTKAEAEAVRSAKEAALNRGEAPANPPGRMTLAEALTSWVADRSGERVTDRTLRIRRNATRRLVEVCGGTMNDAGEVTCTYPLRNIGTGKVGEVFSAFERDGLADNSRVLYRRTLIAFFNWCIRSEWLQRNPIRGSGRFVPNRVRIFSPEELGALMKEADAWWRLFMLTLANTGLRKAEALYLRWADLVGGPEAAEIRIQPAKAGWTTVGGQEVPLLPWNAKNAPSYREVPLPGYVWDALQRWQLRCGGSPYVFIPLKRLQRLSARARQGLYPSEAVYGVDAKFDKLQEMAARSLEVANWERGTPHDFRNTYTNALKGQGVDKSIRDRVLGHGQRDTTSLHYEMLTATDKRRVAAALEAARLGYGNGPPFGAEAYGTFTAHSTRTAAVAG